MMPSQNPLQSVLRDWFFAWLAYFVVISLILIQLPLQGSLPGSTDSWFNLFFFRYYPDYFNAWLLGESIYQPFYPSRYPSFMLGEPSFFGTLIYQPLEWIFRSPIWAYDTYTAIIISLNGLGIYLLSRHIWSNATTAFQAGLLLILSGYTFCSLDQQNVLSYYPALLCLHFFVRYFKEERNAWFVAGIACYVVQIYCSGYNFLFLNVVLMVVGISNFRAMVKQARKPFIWAMLLLGAAAVYPYAYMFLGSDLMDNTVNVVNQTVRSQLSLKWENWFLTHPYNIPYGQDDDVSLIHYISAISPGWSLIILAALGAYMLRRRKIVFLFIMLPILSLLIASGPQLSAGDLKMYSPLYLATDAIGLDNLLRMPVRAYVIMHVSFCIMAAGAISYFTGLRRWIGISFMLLYLIENIPYRLQASESHRHISPPSALMDAAKDMHENEVLWITPSTYNQQRKLKVGLCEENREYIYMYWQSHFKRDMVNGLNAFMPKDNLELRRQLGTGDANTGVSVRTIYISQMELDK